MSSMSSLYLIYCCKKLCKNSKILILYRSVNQARYSCILFYCSCASKLGCLQAEVFNDTFSNKIPYVLVNPNMNRTFFSFQLVFFIACF